MSLQHPELFGHKSDDITLCDQFIHITGMIFYLHCLTEGTKIAIMRKDLDMKNICEYVQKYKITSTFEIPTFLYMLIEEGYAKQYISSLNDLLCGGSSLAPAKWQMIKENLPHMKLLRTLYGSTECGTVTQVKKHELNTAPIPTVGKPVPGVKIKIVDNKTGLLIDPHKIGEICVKSGQVIAGYYKLPELTTQSFDNDGFFKTGDAGYYDENDNLYIVGRYKEIIKVDGDVVSLVELENILYGYEAIKEVCVIGVSDKIRGEVPKAFVVLKDGYKYIDENTIKSYLAERVNCDKQLWGGVVILDEIPKLSFGKYNQKHLILI
jgi:acyl-CoA synthetase (AMP-forming)/AMP-acid ligase II